MLEEPAKSGPSLLAFLEFQRRYQFLAGRVRIEPSVLPEGDAFHE